MAEKKVAAPSADVPKTEIPKVDVSKAETETPKEVAKKAPKAEVQETPVPEKISSEPKDSKIDDVNHETNVVASNHDNPPNYDSAQNYPNQNYRNQNYPNQNYPNQNYPNQNLHPVDEKTYKRPYTTKDKVIGVICAILIPPLAVALKRGGNKDLLINLLLLLLFHPIATIHALYVVFSD